MELVATKFGRKLTSDKEADDFAAYLNSNLNWSTVCDTSLIKRLQPQRIPATLSQSPARRYPGCRSRYF